MKKIFITAMVVFMLIALTGCNGDKNETSQKKRNN